MTKVVFDASALALLHQEPGANIAQDCLALASYYNYPIELKFIR